MTLRHFEIFKAVCTHMSITRAAEELNMTQPAVSIAVRELESFYHTRLFDRIGRRIHLTETGKKLLSYTDSMLDSYARSIADLRSGSSVTTCTIGANVTISEGYLPQIIRALRERCPALSLRVTVDNNRGIENKLSENQIDFALIDTPSAPTGRTVLKLCSEPMEVVCAPQLCSAGELSMAELAKMPLLLREKGSGCRSCVDAAFDKAGQLPVSVAQSISNSGLKILALAGLGATMLPASSVEKEIAAGELARIRIRDGEFVRHYYLVYLTQKYQPPVVRDCIALIREMFAE